MTTKSNGADHGRQAAEKGLVYAAQDLARSMSRETSEALNYFSDLVGEDVFIGGHRYHFVGTLARVEITDAGEAVAYLENAWQIDYDEDEEIKNAFAWGGGLRIPESCVGLGVQPVTGRPVKWQRSWEKYKAQGAEKKGS